MKTKFLQIVWLDVDKSLSKSSCFRGKLYLQYISLKIRENKSPLSFVTAPKAENTLIYMNLVLNKGIKLLNSHWKFTATSFMIDKNYLFLCGIHQFLILNQFESKVFVFIPIVWV